MRLDWFAKLVAGATFLLIIAGGLVTSTGAGLSVPDWPLSYGQFFPPMIGGIRFEHTHRMIAAAVGFLTFILMLWIFKVEKRPWLKRLGLLSFGAVILQAILGGITVIYLLPTAVSILHACLAQTFFSLTVILAAVTSKGWKESQPAEIPQAPSLQQLLFLTTGLLYLQLILGSIVRHTAGRGIVFHTLGAFLVFVPVALAVVKLSKVHPEKFLARSALFLGFTVIVQIFLGLGAFVMRVMLRDSSGAAFGGVFFATAHQATGALILATSAFLTLWSCRLFKAPSKSMSSVLDNQLTMRKMPEITRARYE